MACKVPGLCEARTTQRPEHENLLWTSGKIHIWAFSAVVDCLVRLRDFFVDELWIRDVLKIMTSVLR